VPQPLSYQLASLDPRMIIPLDDGDDDPQLQFPMVDRSAKGDRQPVLNPKKPEPETAKAPEETPVATSAPLTESLAAEKAESAVVSAEVAAGEADIKPETSEPAENVDIPDPVEFVIADAPDSPAEPIEPAMEMARLYFGGQPLGGVPGTIEKWAPGEEPTIVAAPPVSTDSDIKQSALDRKEQLFDLKGGETVAPKGEVTGPGKHPITPAERLKLEGKDRVKAEKCLADAVYFEARGEPVRGQIAVAQVVMNRVFSGFYPRSVCGTVYQNKHRRLACQFTFACDGIPDVVTEPHAWVRATRIARDVLDGKYWVPEVNRATHYHAYWVRPSWIREMKRLYKFGVHTFYRPRAWGDGSDMPSWGTAAATNEAIAKL
jgi:spore germination cell wall hydrolase CwlJ-like protein